MSLHKLQEFAIKTFIVSVALLTLVAVLAIWDVLEDQVLSKSLTTIGVLAFSSFVIVVAVKLIEKSSDSNSDDNGAGGRPNLSARK